MYSFSAWGVSRGKSLGESLGNYLGKLPSKGVGVSVCMHFV